jgi:hypothetical protein
MYSAETCLRMLAGASTGVVVSEFTLTLVPDLDGFGGLVVSMLASGTRVRGFKPGRRPSFGGEVKESVPTLRHVKEPSTSVNYVRASQIPI